MMARAVVVAALPGLALLGARKREAGKCGAVRMQSLARASERLVEDGKRRDSVRLYPCAHVRVGPADTTSYCRTDSSRLRCIQPACLGRRWLR